MKFRIFDSIMENLRNGVKGRFGESSCTKLKRRFGQALEEFFIGKEESDMEVEGSDNMETKATLKEKKMGDERTIEPIKVKDTVETTLQMRAINFLFDSGVNSMIGEVIQGTRGYGASLKGQKMRVILPPDLGLSIIKNGNLYEIMNPMLISEKLTKSQVSNVIICREIRLSMIKEENEVQSI